jgi:hypothetical protein
VYNKSYKQIKEKSDSNKKRGKVCGRAMGDVSTVMGVQIPPPTSYKNPPLFHFLKNRDLLACNCAHIPYFYPLCS